MCVLSFKNGKTQFMACAMVLGMFDNGLGQIKDLLGGHLSLCLKMI
jgi:hypothetical protein